MLLHHYDLSHIYEMRHISSAHQQHFGAFLKVNPIYLAATPMLRIITQIIN